MARASGTAAIAAAVIAASLAACGPNPAVVAPPPGELTMQIHQQALAQATRPGAPKPAVVIAPLSFAEAVQAYDSSVKTVVTTELATVDVSRRPLWLLTMALERAPGAEQAGGPAAVATMRADLEALSSPRAAGDLRPLVHALGVATDLLLALARGPYAGTPEVRQRVDELAESVHELGAQPTSAELGLVLRNAGNALDTIRLASAPSDETPGAPPR